eukprot:4979214-Pyramimonas_sp.AAC.1
MVSRPTFAPCGCFTCVTLPRWFTYALAPLRALVTYTSMPTAIFFSPTLGVPPVFSPSSPPAPRRAASAPSAAAAAGSSPLESSAVAGGHFSKIMASVVKVS